MKLDLGKRIRELRKRDGRTQESLAEALGVTSQAISRWEANGGYPDMEMIPAIANYFAISIEELFGYSSDREEKIKRILAESDRVDERQGFTYYVGSMSEEVNQCIDMLRAAADEFPNEPRILSRLARMLHALGISEQGLIMDYDNETNIVQYDTEQHEQNVYWQEALSAYEKLLRSNPSAKDREIAICQMVPLYCRMGKVKEAMALAEEQDSIIISKEMLMPMATVGEEMMRYQGERIMALLINLRLSISDAMASQSGLSTSEYMHKIFLALLNVYENIFEDGRCGAYHQFIGNMYMHLANYESYIAEDYDKASEYFDKGFDHYSEYERIFKDGGYTYSAPLVLHLNPIEKGELRSLGEDFWQKEVKHLPEDFKKELRKNKKYAVCFE